MYDFKNTRPLIGPKKPGPLTDRNVLKFAYFLTNGAKVRNTFNACFVEGVLGGDYGCCV
jgi:hypothetical protein